MNKLLLRNRRFGLLVRIREAARRGSTDAAQAAQSFDQFFDFTLSQYHTVVPEAMDQQTPWLDAIRDFFRWLDESGWLEVLLKLFLGMLLEKTSAAEASALNVTLTME